MAFAKPHDQFPPMLIRAFENHMNAWAKTQVEQFKKDLEERIKVEAERVVAGIALNLSKHVKMDAIGETLTIELKSFKP